MDDNFIDFCKTGNLNGIINYINMNKINIYSNNDGFIWACAYGHKHIIEYLINLHKIQPTYANINIHVNDNEDFIKACSYGYTYIIKYLLSCGMYYSNNYRQYIIIL